MNIEDAQKVANIISTADDGCKECVRDLCLQMKAAFPEYDWVLRPTELDPYVTGGVMVISSNNTEDNNAS